MLRLLHNELSERLDAPPPALTDADVEYVKASIKAPYLSVKLSTLGGVERASVMISLSIDPKESWVNNIKENSRYANFHIQRARNGYTAENFSGGIHREAGDFRKTTKNTVAELVKKINEWLSKAKPYGK